MNDTDHELHRLRLAHALNALRPEWPVQSLRTLLSHETLRNRALPDVAIAAVRIAYDTNNQTPGQLLRHGPWWTDTHHRNKERPDPPPIQELQLNATRPADPTPHIREMRQALKDRRPRETETVTQ